MTGNEGSAAKSKSPREPSDSVLRRLDAVIEGHQVISYDKDRPDKQCPGVNWSTFGLIETNEMVVVARYEAQRFAIAQKSWLVYPGMIDRIFGMDISDRELCHELAHELWPAVEQYLRTLKAR